MSALDARLAAGAGAATDDRSYRPRLFRLQEADDRRALEQLLGDSPAIRVSNTIRRQLWELVKTRHPSRRLSPGDCEALIEEELAGRAESDYGVWAYYPWAARLVHILDKSEFAALRTNRNTYKITPEERARLATRRIGIVGLSVGQSVALVLALERSFGSLRLADFDTIDLSNLNRLRAGVHEIGVPKVLVTAREIAEIDPYLDIECVFAGVTAETAEQFLGVPEPLDLLIEECDSIDLKVELRHAARRLRIPVLMDTSDRGLIDVERFDLEPDRPIFHGLVGDLDPARLRGLSTEEKIPYVLQIIGTATISTRLRASLLEIDQTISTWPQLASSVTLGGAVAADVARRILLGRQTASGRFYVDIDRCIPDDVPDRPADRAGAQEQPAAHSPAVPVHATDAGLDVSVDRVRRLVSAACQAPSGGNAQPWRWQWRKRCLTQILDARYSRALLDVQSLASIAAHGAAAENVVLAAHADGLGVRLSPFPDPADPVVVASCVFIEKGASGDQPDDADALAEWIGQRATNRRTTERRPLPDAARAALGAAISGVREAELRWLFAERELDELGELLGAGDRLLFLDRELHDELMTEIVFEGSSRPRGIAVETLELSPPDRAGLEVSRSWPALALLKQWGGGRNLEKMSRKGLAAASAAGMLIMPGPDRLDYFTGGRALQRLWLTATKLGIGLQPMTALSYLFARLQRGGSGLEADTRTGLEELWPRWSRLFGLDGNEAQVATFRLTLAEPPSARSGRCPIDDVFEVLP